MDSGTVVAADIAGETDPVASEGRLVSEVVAELLSRAPEWVRQDLSSKEPMTRARAEETLAAMISAALAASA